MAEQIEEKQPEIPKWLKTIQENSWELELLISGGAIFSLFQLSDEFVNFIFTLKMTSHLPGTGPFIILGMFGLKILTLGFIFHLLLRAFWLGLVCVNYVFPSGINKEKILWKRPFKTHVESGDDMHDQIMNVDRLCGTVMYMSIVSAFLVFGLILLIITFVTIPMLLIYGHMEITYLNIFSIILLFYLLDMLLAGAIRGIPYISYVVFPLFWVFDVVTLRFIYQRSLWLFNTNIQKLRFGIGFAIFITISIFFAYTSIYRVMHWPNIIDSREYRWAMAPQDQWWNRWNYRDEAEKEGLEKLLYPSIQSDIIKENYLRIFIPYAVAYDESLNQMNSENTLLSGITQVFIDDSIYNNIEWFNSWHKHNDQIGIRANISIKHLANGKHVLTVADKVTDNQTMHIPFWKDVK
ncbi:MAG: hypothetical protein COA57_05030 [Flavobacteriales bacterium]|nr:MAG: hypothetical protein COA57_05030 [Flavobacteriales bacterium]